METWDAIRSRRNVRRCSDRPITREQLHRILEAGWRAPSSKNEQRWTFVAVTERDRLEELAKVWRYGGHVASSAATVAVLAPPAGDAETRESIQFDLGQAVMSMMIAAADLGIGSCHSAVADQDLARRILGHPPDWSCSLLASFGHPADRPLAPVAKPDRRPFDEVAREERW